MMTVSVAVINFCQDMQLSQSIIILVLSGRCLVIFKIAGIK